MGIVVQKFGGTSVGNGERVRNVAQIVAASFRKGPVIAVVSAMSGGVKSEGTTSLILEASRAATQGEPFQEGLKQIEDDHLAALETAVSTPALRAELESFVREELTRLSNLLEAIAVLRELSPRSQDLLLATGERLSARLLAASLQDSGTEAVYTDLSDVVDEGEREIDPAFFTRLQGKMAERCTPQPDAVTVVTGFFGIAPGGLLHAVGRGYSDFTAAMIAAGLGRKQVEELQVWKEVDGIFTADPRRVPTARVLARISPTEAAELTYFGSEVLHPFTMERVVSADIPIRIKNTFKPESDGTLILPQREKPAARVTAVTAKRGITIVTVQSNRMYNAYGFLAGVFQALAEMGVVVDLVSTSEVSVSFTLDREDGLDRLRGGLERFGTVDVETGRAILSMVGEGMKFVPGTAGQMFSALGGAGVNIEMISQGASEINISCVIKEEDTEAGLRAVHRSFLEAP
ncbi:MAG: aspartate kinase [SAR324 cluster bacterium]|nr:aspartate kinase [SAR324 cluster bacterium]